MTEDQYQKAQEINHHVTFLPGTFDKRFCRDIASVSKDKELTEKQAILLENMYHRYRRQIPNHEKKCRICSGEIKPYQRKQKVLEDNQKLAEWKASVLPAEQEQDPQLPLFE